MSGELERRCRLCGRQVGDVNDLGGQPLRCDPDGELGPLCNGFFDETGRERIDCHHKREWARAARFGSALARDRSDRDAAASMREAERAAKKKPRKGQLSLVGDEQEGPPF